jgi:hypothetical protein
MSGNAMQLVSHPRTAHAAIRGVTAELERDGTRFGCRYSIAGAAKELIWEPGEPSRADELWRHTCCELFVMAEGGGYLEFNFAPSGQWAAYRFDGYRRGIRDLEYVVPRLTVDQGNERLVLHAEVDLPAIAAIAVGLSAVIETADGTKSYWALAHPPGKPDFHHPDCFALKLPAAGGA